MTASDPIPPAPPKRRRRGAPRGRGWHAARVGLWLLTLPVIFVVIALAMMFDRDITAPDWVTQEVAARAGGMLGGGAVEFGEITVRLGPDLHPRIRLRDTVLTDAAGTPLAEVEEVDATISPRGLLFDRAALVQHVALRGTAIDLTRDAQGQFRLAFDLPQAGGGALLADGVAGLVRQIDGLRDRPALAAMESLTLDGLALTYTDDRAGRVWTTADGDLTLEIDRAGTHAVARLRVDGDKGATTLDLRLSSPRDSDAATLAVEVAEAQARDLASQSAALRFLGALDAPLSASLRTDVSDDGTLGLLEAALTIGAGAVQPGPQMAPLRFDGVSAALSFDPRAQRLTFDDVTVASDWGRLRAKGQALAQDIVGGVPEALVGQFTLTDIALNPAGLYPAPVTLEQADIALRLRFDPFRLDVGQVSLSDPTLTLTARGSLDATPEG